MAANEIQEESSASSSSLSPEFSYDVFLSFRGEDTRNNFTGHLYAALYGCGFLTFIDNALQRGEEIEAELLKTIERSRSAVIIFSRNYADSPWCLNELVKILDCKRTNKQIVLPVFYDVRPSEVREQKGSFAEAISRLENLHKGCEVGRWRDALTEAGSLSGRHLQNEANGHEPQFIGEIVGDISNKLNLSLTCLHVANYPVGINSRVQLVKSFLSLESDDVRIVGICGIGGSGKSTIAKAVYNHIHRNFDHRSFLANAGRDSEQHDKLVFLQNQLLSDITKTTTLPIKDVDNGTEVLKVRLSCVRVLLVIDNVKSIHLLDTLAIRRDSFRSGSRIILITRDVSLLEHLDVDGVYRPELLSCYESLSLFNCHAFGTNRPREEYKGLLKEVLGYAGGLPLAHVVLGSLLCGKTISEWESTLGKLRLIPDDKIHSPLVISYNSLSDDQRDLFLDIACFFVGRGKKFVIDVLKRYDFFVEDELEVLSRLHLIRIELGLVMMHDLIRDMGREIVRRENHKEPGKRSRLWYRDDVLDVLTSHVGPLNVEGLVLNFSRSDDVPVNVQAFAQMDKLRVLVLNNVRRLSGNFACPSRNLRWLCWSGFPLESIPSNLFMEKLVVIEMRYSSLKQVWKGRKILSKLKSLDLSHSYQLIKTPDFSEATNLEKLFLNNCTRLVKVHPSIECLRKLEILDLKNCESLEELPPGIWKSTSLKDLFLSGCVKLGKQQEFNGSTSKLWFPLLFYWASLIRNLNSICRSLASIVRLNLAKNNFSYVCNELGGLSSLESLNLSGNHFSPSSSISHLSRLQFYHLIQGGRLQSLQELPGIPEAVFSSYSRHCTSLERVSIGSDRKLATLTCSGYNKLVENHNANIFRKNLFENQELCTTGKFRILNPGGKIPNLFHHRSAGSVVSFAVSSRRDWKIRGWILCVVLAACVDEFGAEEDESFGYPLLYYVRNKTKDFEGSYEASFNDIPGTLEDYTWLHYAPQHDHEPQIEAGDEVEFSVVVTDQTQFQVKKCGVHPIYEGDEKDYLSSDIQYGFPLSSNQVDILHKIVAADHVVTDNYLVGHSSVHLLLCVFVCLVLIFLCLRCLPFIWGYHL